MHFNLAENRRDSDFPFAFMASYMTQLSAQAKARHIPLGQALRDDARAVNKNKLLALLMPVQRAAAACAWLRLMVEASEIFHPPRWTVGDAMQFLSSVLDLEAAGVIVRMPASWPGRPARPRVTATVGARAPSAFGLGGLLDFHAEMTLKGEQLTEGGRSQRAARRDPGSDAARPLG